MSYRGDTGGGDRQHSECVADGPVTPGRSVIEAIECNTARFVDLAGEAGSVTPTYLVLAAAEGATASLTRTDVFSLPEIQNGLAYYGPDTDSVRVRTTGDRQNVLREHVAELASRTSQNAYEFAGARFSLDVVQG